MVGVACRLPAAEALGHEAVAEWLRLLERERRGLRLPLLRRVCRRLDAVPAADGHMGLAVADILHGLEMDDETLTAAVIHVARLPEARVAEAVTPTVAAMLGGVG